MPRCHFCGQPIWGEYVNALGTTWHPEHFLCAGCGRSLGSESFLLGEGKPYHRTCYLASQAPHCAFCGQPIENEYMQLEGRSYHVACFREHVAPRCIYCQKPLTGKYLIDHWGEVFCPEHETEFPRCSFCNRLIPPQQQQQGWQEYESLRCAVCRTNAIETAEQAQPLFNQCKQWIAQQGFRFNQLPLRLELCGRARLITLFQGRPVNHPQGITLTSSRVLQGRVIERRIEGVAVLQGMPALLFAGVVLHELGHVWLTVHGITELPAWAEEGFCQLLSYRYYAGLDTQEARYRVESLEREADPIYGSGFRQVRDLAERAGFARLVETLQRTKRLP